MTDFLVGFHEHYKRVIAAADLQDEHRLAVSSTGEREAEPEYPGAGRKSVMGPQCKQTPGGPYVFYQRVANADLKSTGLRMSACLAAMDNCRTDMFTTCDMSVESFRKVNDPFVEVAIELLPAIKMLGKDSSRGGLLHQMNQGALLSWLRLEALFGWPTFPMRSEETTIFHVGKDRNSGVKEPICTARFIEAFTHEDGSGALAGETWEQASDQYWSNVKANHTAGRLSMDRKLESFYTSEDTPFEPSDFAKVKWLMSHSYGDLWDILYHGKTSDLLWEVNALAGGVFAALVADESDPQAMAINLPKPMKVGTRYEVLCFLAAQEKRAVYLVVPEGRLSPSEVVLAVCARYNWQGVPQNGKTLCREDLQLLAGPSRAALVNFAAGAEAKATKTLDFGKLIS